MFPSHNQRLCYLNRYQSTLVLLQLICSLPYSSVLTAEVLAPNIISRSKRLSFLQDYVQSIRCLQQLLVNFEIWLYNLTSSSSTSMCWKHLFTQFFNLYNLSLATPLQASYTSISVSSVHTLSTQYFTTTYSQYQESFVVFHSHFITCINFH